MAGKKGEAKEELGFGAALEELEEILQRIEGEEIDIDDLAAELQRTAELLDLCRGKLRKAELEVSQIVQTLERDAAEGDEDEASGKEGADADENDGEDDVEDDDIPF